MAKEAQGDCYLIESLSDADDADDVEKRRLDRERSDVRGTCAILNYPKRPSETLGGSTFALNPVMRQLKNGRRHEIRLGEDMLDTRGFKLVEHDTQVQDFGNLAEMQQVFYKELEELCKKNISGVERCVVFDHKCRRGGDAVHAGSWSEEMQSIATGFGNVIKPLELVHGDYTGPDAIERVRALAKVPSWDSTRNFAPQLSDSEVQEILANDRFMLINVWRNIDRSKALRRFPLACLDASTVNDEDVFDWVPAQSDFPVYDGFAAHPDNFVPGQLCVEANDKHEWYYFPEMTCSEALMFKTFDSAAATVGQEQIARACFHTAFQDSATETHDPVRQTCEARLLVALRSE